MENASGILANRIGALLTTLQQEPETVVILVQTYVYLQPSAQQISWIEKCIASQRGQCAQSFVSFVLGQRLVLCGICFFF